MSWELGFGIGALLLLLVLGWGVVQSRRAGPREEALAEAGAREAYATAGDSDAPPRSGRRKAVPPLVWVVVVLLLAWMILAAVMLRHERARPGEAVTSTLEHVPPGEQAAPAVTAPATEPNPSR